MLTGGGGGARVIPTTLVESHAVVILGGPSDTVITLDKPTHNADQVVVIFQGVNYSGQCHVEGLGATWAQLHIGSYYAENSDSGTTWATIAPSGQDEIVISTPSLNGGVGVFVYVIRRQNNCPQSVAEATQGGSFNGPNNPPLIAADAPLQLLFVTAVGESNPQDKTAESPNGRWDAPLQLGFVTPLGQTVFAAASWRETQAAAEASTMDFAGGVRCGSNLMQLPPPIPA